MCLEAGVNIMYTLNLIKVIKDGTKITSAEFQNEDGEELQATSLFFEIEGIDKETYNKYCSEKMDIKGDDHFDKVIAKETEAGRYNVERKRLGTYEAIDGTWKVNGTRICNVDATNVTELTNAVITGRKQMYDIISMLKRRIPGCENVQLKTSASMLGIRESRRIKGEYILKADDLTNGTIFEDAIFKCSNSIDFHSNNRGCYVPNKTKFYMVPYRSLISVGIENMLVAGRSISADKLALSAIRVMPPCFAMGQAAGTAAAICAKRNVGFRNINVDELKAQLRKQQVNI